ncbi:MAG: ATP-dependent zinc metalloprotease FtsH [Propionibacteriaceae bacterium]|jgi:cell division protease FtsH|nr:ATP-dependent zinc metalloprotease FtsH [Propionibacteriaceae bacterium]
MTSPANQVGTPQPTKGATVSNADRPVLRPKKPTGQPPIIRPAATPAPEGAKPWRTEGLPDKKDGGLPTPSSDGSKKPAGPGGLPTNWRFWVSAVLLLFAFWYASSWINSRDTPPDISYNEFKAQVVSDNVASIHVKGDSIDGELKVAAPLPDGEEGITYTKFVTERPTWATPGLEELLNEHNVPITAAPVYEEAPLWQTLLTGLVPWLLIIGVYVWFLRKMSKGGSPFGGFQRDVKPVEREKVRVNFSDVAGIDEVKDQVSEIVDFLKNPDKYRKVGARAPKGVLLEGAPGTGKTLLARATAGEAEVPFFSASASEFIEMIVGVGAQRVRQLFDEARKAAPSIIFIDEIDAIGRARGSSRSMGGHDEREQTLNQILTEMDGFDGTEGVVVIAATNRADVLDAALTRPGRFDRVITVNSPDAEGREQILQVHTRKIPLADGVDLHDIALTTPGMTGADLANLANEAALIAAKRDDTKVYQKDFMNALEKIQLGVARSVIIPEDERRRTAYHEAGHALLGMLQKGADPVRKVSIIPRGQALGVTLSTPDTDKYGYDEEYLRGRIVGALGGMAAENAVFGVTTTGADSDLRSATNIARQMVGKWGMSKRVGPMQVLSDNYDPRSMGISEATLALMDDEVRRIIGECQVKAVQLLTDHRDKLDAIVSALLVNETLDEDAVYAAAGIEREVSDVEMVKTNKHGADGSVAGAAGAGTTGAAGSPADQHKPVVDAPWGPPSAADKIEEHPTN